jgi:hypothetical protein
MEKNRMIAFRPLEMLERKIIPRPMSDIRIVINPLSDANIVRLQNVDNEKEKENENEKEKEKETENVLKLPQPALNLKIVDKRRSSAIDRAQILERLRNKSAVQVIDDKDVKTPDVSTEVIPDIVPVKTPKRLIIRSPATIEPVSEPVSAPVSEPVSAPVSEPPIKPIEEMPPTDDEVLRDLEDITRATEEIPIVLPEPSAVGRKRKQKKAAIQVEPETDVDLTTTVIRTQTVSDRLPKERERIIVKAPTYYMNNRKIFIQKLTQMFKPYQDELIETADSVSCDSNGKTVDFDLLLHQKIVRDYLNLYTPYRGLLLYHGLGSGKTCTSIAIAEGMKSNKRVFIMTPASLKMNFFSEMKKCGDHLYKKNQYWEFISIDGNPEYVGVLSKALSLSSEYIREYGGAWLVNITKPSNYTELSTNDQLNVDVQLNEMIRSKYTDVNYNGLNMKKMQALTGDFTRNPFDNAVVVIDEAHNFVSRIVNKIKQPKSIAYMLYHYLMSASNARIVLLTGTPIINYPNEIGILYNILRGYIKTWTLPIKWENKTTKLNTDTLLSMLDDAKLKTYDYVSYADNKLTITRNPFGFINAKKRGALKGTRRIAKVDKVAGGKPSARKTLKKGPPSRAFAEKLTFTEMEIEPDAQLAPELQKGFNTDDRYYGGAAGEDVFDRYNGVYLDETGNITDTQFINEVMKILKSSKNALTIVDKNIEVVNNKALPDDSEEFLNMFVDADSGNALNMNLFQRRILGLTSYFRSAQERLLPRYETTEKGDLYHVVKTEMSAHQFGVYEKIRKDEADREKKAKKMQRKGDGLYNIATTYRIFSRAACNFTFPESIVRPVPTIKENTDITENAFDIIIEEKEDDAEPVETVIADSEATKYAGRIENALQELDVKMDGTNISQYLSKDALPIYSPKFAQILENISSPLNEGLHLLYSHFRTIEGIGILRMVLLANGFAEFKLQKTSDGWGVIETEEDVGKPRFVLYTGTETSEEKELIRNVYNGTWEFVPQSLSAQLRKRAENNIYGEIIKLIMITSSGAEGINLKNTRYVHITEPYWHMVRVEQVVGRARRICSHQDLPENMRTVKVFLYVSTLTEEQKTNEKNIELRIRDVSKVDKKTPVSTDESLYEIASIKQRINNHILTAVKESAIDCNIYSAQKTNKETGEELVCYGFGKVESNQFSSYPTLEKDQTVKEGLDVKEKRWRGVKIVFDGIEYILNKETNEVYDTGSYARAVNTGSEPILYGRLETINGKYRLILS